MTSKALVESDFYSEGILQLFTKNFNDDLDFI